ncbi:ABC transporter substrate-binding protein, partial [uncultured Veillonella sp.]|uniref:ABC transporter substrate-binding protein n=1 Tax=uncultured Veillonella sp. TaxID=159268 RepID=UPI0025E429E6
VPKDPQKIAVLSNSVLSMLYAVDGKAISRVNTTDSLPPEIEALPALGQTANINMEQLLGLNPDLVLGLENQHKKYEAQLQSSKIPTVLINYDGIKDNAPLLTFLGELTNHQDKAKTVIATYENNIAKVKDAVKGQQPARVAVLRATGKGVTAETDASITASMVKELGMTNVVTSHLDKTTTDKTVPYSLETLAADDPDIIFVVTMGKEEEITKAMKKAMTDNPAWANLKAVQNNRVVYLPSKLFLLNPGLQTPEAMARLVKEAYSIDVTF